MCVYIYNRDTMAQIHMRKAKQIENPQKQKLYEILHNLSRHFF